MNDERVILPVGQQVSLPGHFDSPVMLEAARTLAKGYECRVRLPDGTLDEAVISEQEAAAVVGAAPVADSKTALVNADQLRLLVESARIRLAQLQGRLGDAEQDEDDLDEAERDQLADGLTDAIELDQLRAEIAALQELIARARRVRDQGADSKLTALHECLTRAEFHESTDGRGKLTANWQSVVEDAALTTGEKEERKKGQKQLI